MLLRKDSGLLIEYKDYIKAIWKELDGDPSKVYIASYNAHVGISSRGSIFQNDTFSVLKEINENTTGSRILIGNGPSCGSDLPARLTNAAEFFRNITWRTRTASHLKCWIFHRRSGEVKALCGGRNLGDSEWSDISVFLSHKDSIFLSKYFDDIWSSFIPVKISPRLKVRVSGKPLK